MILSPVAAVAAGWFTIYLFFRKARAWLLAYVVGAVGFTLIAIYLARGSWLEEQVEAGAALAAHWLSSLVGIPTRVFFDAPGTLLVLIVYQVMGWTAVEIDIECSGILELAAFAGLVLFFEGFEWWKRLLILTGGLLLTFGMNVIRILIVVATIHRGGKDAIYLAHTLIGRAVFFAMVIGLYWYVFTRLTMETIRRRISGDR